MQGFFDAYVEAALWSSTDESRPDGGDPLDQNYVPANIARDTFEAMRSDCERFWTDNEEHLTAENYEGRFGADAQAGHDFWLTRNGHGCGFWDGDWKEPAASILTAAAKAFGSFDLYIEDDGQIYGQ